MLAVTAWPMAVAAQHTGHGQQPQGPPPAADPHAQHGEQQAATLPAFIPPVTDADRKAAFPDVMGHSVHDEAVNFFVVADELEWQTGSGEPGFTWESKGWVGKDRDRLWFRTEGEASEGDLESGQVQLLYGRAVWRWWDLVGGVRQDFRPGSPQTWAAIGLQGLAPYWFEVEATAYIGGSGRTLFTFETEYELLLTNRLVLQPLLEIDIHGKDDEERGAGAGLSEVETGIRLRYEVRRELAPYVGFVWHQKFYGTADYARAAGERVSGAKLALGLRWWM
jgi:copper resistance protein B